MTKRFGFTLAEVLVTLSIIGVVAAMTVPTLMNNTSNQEYSAAFKKVMSTLNQAITMQYALDGTDMRAYNKVTATTVFAEGNESTSVAEMFKERLQVVSTTTERTDGHTGSENAAIYLSDGMVIEFPAGGFVSNTCKQNRGDLGDSFEDAFTEAAEDVCLYSLLVDVNGNKGKCIHSEQKNNTSAKNKRLNPGDCFVVDIYSDGAKPGTWIGKQIMFNSK